jgi:dihydroxyacetone kinase-like predicted kinase
MLRLIPSGDFDSVVEDMTDAVGDVETGEITTATRSVEIDGVQVKSGEIIVLHNGKLVLATDNLEKACLGLMKIAHAEYFELVTLFYGADTPNPEVIHIADAIRSAYPELEVEVQDGGQPHYQFIVSIE